MFQLNQYMLEWLYPRPNIWCHAGWNLFHKFAVAWMVCSQCSKVISWEGEPSHAVMPIVSPIPSKAPSELALGHTKRWKPVWLGTWLLLISGELFGARNPEPRATWLSRVWVEVGMAREVIHNLATACSSNFRGYESTCLGVWPRVDAESPVFCYLPPLHSAQPQAMCQMFQALPPPPSFMTTLTTVRILCLMWRLLWMLPSPKTKRQATN